MHLPLSQNSDSETKRTHDSVWSTLYLICSHSKSRTRLFFSMTMTMIVATLLVISFTCCVAFEMRDTTLGLNEVVWHSEPSQIFIGSPTILRLANGDILTACDRFGNLSRVYVRAYVCVGVFVCFSMTWSAPLTFCPLPLSLFLSHCLWHVLLAEYVKQISTLVLFAGMLCVFKPMVCCEPYAVRLYCCMVLCMLSSAI
eukprot:m.135109 g.135109  ORF g.135109 m.135109 type:complete len:199 (-) comp13972_c1_seq3:3820-4416(-)